MFRAILGIVGVLMVLVPDRIVEVSERLALESPGQCERKSWVVPLGRIEGAAYLVVAWRGDGLYSSFKKLLGVLGLVALASPGRFVDGAAAMAYRNSEHCELKPWVYPVARLFGVLYLLLALDEFLRD